MQFFYDPLHDFYDILSTQTTSRGILNWLFYILKIYVFFLPFDLGTGRWFNPHREILLKNIYFRFIHRENFDKIE